MKSSTALLASTFLALLSTPTTLAFPPSAPTNDSLQARTPSVPVPLPRAVTPSALFPPQYSYSSGFTTASGISTKGISKVALSDSALGVTRVQAGLSHPVVSEGGRTAWEARFPRGSYKPSAEPRGGFGFYVGGAEAWRARVAGGAKHVLVAYSVKFQDGWAWNKGVGGIGESAFGCSGGRQEDRNGCFDVRLMWRTNGAGELYPYLPLTKENNDALLAVPPQSIANSDYGYSVGRGSFTFPAGKWVSVAERVKLNDIGKKNGEVQIWFNGKSVIDVKGLTLRTSSKSVVQGMHFQTFFGGSSSDWASPKDQKAWFADVSGAIIN